MPNGDRILLLRLLHLLCIFDANGDQHHVLTRLDIRFACPTTLLGVLPLEMGNNPEVDVQQVRNAA
jgi:hypothetical protein